MAAKGKVSTSRSCCFASTAPHRTHFELETSNEILASFFFWKVSASAERFHLNCRRSRKGNFKESLAGLQQAQRDAETMNQQHQKQKSRQLKFCLFGCHPVDPGGTAPLWLSKYFDFDTENGKEQLKSSECLSVAVFRRSTWETWETCIFSLVHPLSSVFVQM